MEILQRSELARLIMKNIIIILMMVFIGCKTGQQVFTDKTTSKSLKEDGGKIKNLATDSKGLAVDIKTEAVKSNPDLIKIGDNASIISEKQSGILMLSDNVIESSDYVKQKDKQLKILSASNAKLKKELSSKTTKIFWMLGAGLLLAGLYCFYAHNIWAGLCCFGGVLASLAVTWFISHIGVVIGVFVAIVVVYLGTKHNNKVKDELYDTVDHYKDSLRDIHLKGEARKVIQRIQSKDTQDEIKKIKKKRAKTKK